MGIGWVVSRGSDHIENEPGDRGERIAAQAIYGRSGQQSLYDGRQQDLAFEKPVGGSADERHHVRLWMTLEKGAEQRPVWLASATFDRGVGISRYTGQITHHIAPNIDAERDLVIAELSRAGVLMQIYQVSGIGPTINGRNGEGDRYFTDGEITVGVIRPQAMAEGGLPG